MLQPSETILEQSRIRIEQIYPELNAGRYPVKRCVGDTLEVWADIFMDGHDLIRAAVLYAAPGESDWREAPMKDLTNDRWHGSFPLEKQGRWRFTIEAWHDVFGSWARDTRKKLEAGQSINLELIEGRQIIDHIFSGKNTGEKAKAHKQCQKWLALKEEALAQALLSPEAETLIALYEPRDNAMRYERTLEVVVDRELACYGAWYEMVPRSQGTDPKRGSTFAECEERLPDIQAMGFDVIYFTPIHPIGTAFRKGKNNSLTAQPDEPGSPYAIGSSEGGHTAVHPELGTLKDFKHFVKAAKKHGMEVALDFAVQCSPDHPWVKEHKDWFSIRPDGTIKYAENPPKKYQDIVNVNFQSPDASALWAELRRAVQFWIDQGVTIFRVDNPHTKPFAFWEWLIGGIKEKHPEIIFLSEAFTRPKVMYALAKLGFTQSYTYFTWRNTKAELITYLTELTTDWPKDFFRPNFFPTTPDIFPYYLHNSGRPGFMTRLALAATLAGSYGMVNGYELCDGEPLPDGKGGFKEEYLDSEKYQFKTRDWNGPGPYPGGNIKAFVTKLNLIRKHNSSLKAFTSLKFHPASNEQVIFYSKNDADGWIFVAVNLDPKQVQEAHIILPLALMGIGPDETYAPEDLLQGHSWKWTSQHQHLRLDPAINPVAIFRIKP